MSHFFNKDSYININNNQMIQIGEDAAAEHKMPGGDQTSRSSGHTPKMNSFTLDGVDASMILLTVCFVVIIVVQATLALCFLWEMRANVRAIRLNSDAIKDDKTPRNPPR